MKVKQLLNESENNAENNENEEIIHPVMCPKCGRPILTTTHPNADYCLYCEKREKAKVGVFTR